ncbi:MAG TPA: hypothetical protein VLE71_03855, partial [Actinomycetota bacterium]|nr:hypothetical protein [Actinomycetota bacterium]
LDLLGEDDPERVEAESVDAWRSLVTEAGEDVSTRPEPTEWSALECLGHADDDPAELLDLFGALRRANLSLWARTAPERRARVGIHAERGPESVDLMFRLLAGHDRFHLAQARRTLDAVRA